jgi:hypothetical protein
MRTFTQFIHHHMKRLDDSLRMVHNSRSDVKLKTHAYVQFAKMLHDWREYKGIMEPRTWALEWLNKNNDEIVDNFMRYLIVERWD